MRRGLVAIAALGACVDVAERRATEPVAPDAGVAAPAPAGPIVRRPGGAVRVVAIRTPQGYASFVGVWRHREEGQDERLELKDSGTFEWTIDRSGSNCRIAGTVVLATTVDDAATHDPSAPSPPPSEEPDAQPALTWTMTTNTCNGEYQGRTASDVIVSHDFTHLVLKDAEFSMAPVPYTRE
jgi:hypothetical protein